MSDPTLNDTQVNVLDGKLNEDRWSQLDETAKGVPEMTERRKYSRRTRGSDVGPDTSASELLEAQEQLLAEKRAKASAAARKKAQAEARRQADAKARAQAEADALAQAEEAARLEAEEEARLAEEARLIAEEEARLEDARLRAEEEARLAEEDYADEEDDAEEPLVLTPSQVVTAPATGRRPSARAPRFDWGNLGTFAVDEKHLENGRVISAAREDLAHTAFDVLRTRVLQALRKNKWSRVAITSPSKDCGKTFTSANLAIAMSRQENSNTVLFDFDMRRPSLAKLFGVRDAGALGDVLRGDVAPEDHLRRMGNNSIDVGDNLAFGFNDRVEPYASELLQDPDAGDILDDMQQRMGANVLLFDMPPALYHDDVIAARHLFDCVLLVIGGGITKPSEVRDVENRLGSDVPLLGTVLNMSQGAGITKYSY